MHLGTTKRYFWQANSKHPVSVEFILRRGKVIVGLGLWRNYQQSNYDMLALFFQFSRSRKLREDWTAEVLSCAFSVFCQQGLDLIIDPGVPSTHYSWEGDYLFWSQDNSSLLGTLWPWRCVKGNLPTGIASCCVDPSVEDLRQQSNNKRDRKVAIHFSAAWSNFTLTTLQMFP